MTENNNRRDPNAAIAASRSALEAATDAGYGNVLRLVEDWIGTGTDDERKQLTDALEPHLATPASRQRLLGIMQQASAPSSGTLALFGQAGTSQTDTGVDANHPVVRQLIGLRTTNKGQFDWLMDVFKKTIQLGQNNTKQAAKVTTFLNNVIADADKPNGDFAVGDDPSSLGGVNLKIVTEFRQRNDDLDQQVRDLNQKLSAVQMHVLATAESTEAYIWHVSQGHVPPPDGGINKLRDDQDALYRLVGITHRPNDGSPVPTA